MNRSGFVRSSLPEGAGARSAAEGVIPTESLRSIKSIKLSNCTIATFLESFEEEVDYLRKLKIDDIEIAAFIDELKYNIAL